MLWFLHHLLPPRSIIPAPNRPKVRKNIKKNNRNLIAVKIILKVNINMLTITSNVTLATFFDPLKKPCQVILKTSFSPHKNTFIKQVYLMISALIVVTSSFKNCLMACCTSR